MIVEARTVSPMIWLMLVWLVFLPVGGFYLGTVMATGSLAPWRKRRLRVEITSGQPAICKVWRGGVLVFSGQDHSATIREERRPERL